MTSAGVIKHSGVVVRIEGDRIFVKMTVGSACGSCQARMVCGASDSKEKIVEVESPVASEYHIGEEVEVALQKRSMGIKSVVVAYLIPLLVLGVILFGSILVGAGEGIAALASLVAVGVYYALLYILRDKIGKTVKFIITKQTK